MSAFTACLNLFLVCIVVFVETKCPPNWLTWQDSCYTFLPERMNWFNASRVCDRSGSALAMPESKQEQDFIWREMNTWKVHVGVNATANFKLWIECTKYSNYNMTDPTQLTCHGEKVVSKYTNWNGRHYRDAGQDCITMRSANRSANGQWGDTGCHARAFAACEMRVSPRVYSLTANGDGHFTPLCLLNHVMKNLTAGGVIGCGQACWAEPYCHSFNLWQQGKICQLNNASRLEADVTTDLKYVEDCLLFEL